MILYQIIYYSDNFLELSLIFIKVSLLYLFLIVLSGVGILLRTDSLLKPLLEIFPSILLHRGVFIFINWTKIPNKPVGK